MEVGTADISLEWGTGGEFQIPVGQIQHKSNIGASMEPLLKWPCSDVDHDQATLITLESKLDVPRLILYKGKNQCEFDNFLLQYYNMFTMKLNMYDTNGH